VKPEDISRIQKILSLYPTLEETQEAISKEFPDVVVTHNPKKRRNVNANV
jgi:hypothetical protein